MYKFKKKIGKVFTSKFVETGPSSYKKKNLPGSGLTKVEKHWFRRCVTITKDSECFHLRFDIWKSTVATSGRSLVGVCSYQA